MDDSHLIGEFLEYGSNISGNYTTDYKIEDAKEPVLKEAMKTRPRQARWSYSPRVAIDLTSSRMTWRSLLRLEIFANMDQNFHAAVEGRPVPGT